MTLAVVLGLMVVLSGPAQGQTLLQRLEGRLNNALGPADPAATPPANPLPGQPTAGQPTPANLPAPGDAQPGYLGLIGDDAPEGAGLQVTSVVPDGPAEKGGLRAGDLVLFANGLAIHNQDDMETALVDQGPGAGIPVTVLREGKKETFTVTLGTRTPPVPARDAEDPGPPPFAAPPAGAGLSLAVPPSAATLGVTAAPITEDAVARYGLSVRRGALITAVRPGTPADRAGLPVGAVVVAVDGRRIDTNDDLIGAVRSSQPGQELELSYYQRDRLFRKTVRLAPATPAIAPGLSLGISPSGAPATDRPLLNKVGRLIDGISRGGTGALPGPGLGIANGVPSLAPGTLPQGFQEAPTLPNQGVLGTMQERIDAQERDVRTLNERVRSLEEKLGAPAKNSDADLRLTPPAPPKPAVTP
jgi:membrane-associated protease RseP (regulator of RpoE activity)